MDAFGIGIALQAQARIFFQMLRGSGRTTQLLAALKDGDRVVFTNSQEARRVERLAKQINLEIEGVTIHPSRPGDLIDKLRERGTPKGRLVFDHTWVEDFYRLALERTAADLDYFQREFGGRGEPHIETRLKAVEMSRWGA